MSIVSSVKLLEFCYIYMNCVSRFHLTNPDHWWWGRKGKGTMETVIDGSCIVGIAFSVRKCYICHDISSSCMLLFRILFTSLQIFAFLESSRWGWMTVHLHLECLNVPLKYSCAKSRSRHVKRTSCAIESRRHWIRGCVSIGHCWSRISFRVTFISNSFLACILQKHTQ